MPDGRFPNVFRKSGHSAIAQERKELNMPLRLARELKSRLHRLTRATPAATIQAATIQTVDKLPHTAPKTPARLLSGHLSPDAGLYADRRQILSLLDSGGVFVEVGVGVGYFSRYILDVLRPTKFYAIDLFDLHELPELWGRPTSDMFGDLTHEQYYRKQFGAEIETETVRVLNGDSQKLLAEFADASVDAIYLDATHLYENVAAELREAARIVKDDGLIVLNDYIMYDHRTRAEYGVIHAANEFIVENGWEVVGFALQHEMYCDIADPATKGD